MKIKYKNLQEVSDTQKYEIYFKFITALITTLSLVILPFLPSTNHEQITTATYTDEEKVLAAANNNNNNNNNNNSSSSSSSSTTPEIVTSKNIYMHMKSAYSVPYTKRMVLLSVVLGLSNELTGLLWQDSFRSVFPLKFDVIKFILIIL